MCNTHTHSGRYGYFVLLLFLMSLPSCIGDSEVSQFEGSLKLKDARIMTAKLWYENWQQDKEIANLLGLETKSASKTKDTLLSSKVRGEPLWEMARVGADEVVEVPLKLSQGMTFSNSKNPKEAELNASVTRLLILKDDQGFYYSVYMHIQADADYLSACGYDLQKTAYKNVQPGFTGRVFYISEEGGFINGWIYVNGHINGEITQMRNIENKLAEQPKTKAVAACWYEYYAEYVRDCIYAINYCGPWVLVYEYEATICTGGGGGGGTNPPGTQYTVSVNASPFVGGTVSPSKSYSFGALAVITATPAAGYTFVNWTGSVTSTSPTYTFTVTGNASFTANFRDDSPCGKLSNKDQNFRDKLGDLKTKATSMNRETAYIRLADGSYSTAVGTKRGKVPIGVTYPLTEYMHNHNTGLLPIYGVEDLGVLYTLYARGKIVNISEFSFSLATSDNVYDLKITNVAQFVAFGYQFLTSDEGKYEAEDKLDIRNGMSPDKAEKRFLEFISDKGLTLFKSFSNSQYSQWGKVQNVNDNIVVVNCNP